VGARVCIRWIAFDDRNRKTFPREIMGNTEPNDPAAADNYTARVCSGHSLRGRLASYLTNIEQLDGRWWIPQKRFEMVAYLRPRAFPASRLHFRLILFSMLIGF
jgi:hypothetical protein